MRAPETGGNILQSKKNDIVFNLLLDLDLEFDNKNYINKNV